MKYLSLTKSYVKATSVEGKEKSKLLKTTLTLFFDLIIKSMSDITNITPRYIQNTHARDFCLLNHVRIKSEVTTM